ncbi:hypothetical protein Tco_0596669 [Tanacetum coccineum]
MSPQSSLQPKVKELESEQESEYSEEDQDDDEEVYWIDFDEEEEKKDDTNDDKSIDLEMTDDEETDEQFVHGVEQVNDDKDEEMTNAEVEEFGNGDEEYTDAAKTDAGKTEEDTTYAEINSLLDMKFQSEVPYIQSPSVLRVPVSVIYEPSVLSLVLRAPMTTLPLPSVSTIPLVRHQTTTPILTPPITTDAPTITIAVPESDALTSQVPNVVEHYLGLKIDDDLQKVLQRHTADLIQKYSVKPTPESSKIQKPTINL